LAGKKVLLVIQIGGGKKMQVKNDSAELLFFSHFWVFEVRRFRNPTNKISMALFSCFQRVLKDLANEKLPRLYAHLEHIEVDMSLFTFNWFLTVFVDNIPVETFLRIWDAFLYEGTKVGSVFITSFTYFVPVFLKNFLKIYFETKKPCLTRSL
jgi:hypothetical protein